MISTKSKVKDMKKRKVGITVIWMLLPILLFGIWGVQFAGDHVRVYAAETESSLPEDVMQEAMEILEAAGEDGLSGDESQQLFSLGLTEDQIKMLQRLSQTESDTSSTEEWQEMHLKWFERPLVRFGLGSIAILAVCMVLIFALFRIYRKAKQ